MNVIVHIGTPKTGTTTIQEYLHNNKNILNEHGYHFIQSVGGKSSSYLAQLCSVSNKMYDDQYEELQKVIYTKFDPKFILFFKLAIFDKILPTQEEKNKIEKLFDNEIKLLSNNIHTIIISAESLFSKLENKNEVEIFYKFLSLRFNNIKIICYLREQGEQIVSAYSTGIKSEIPIPSLKDLISVYPLIAKSTYLNYFKRLNIWEKLFGIENMSVNIYNKKMFINNELLDDFTGKIHLSLIGLLNKNISAQNQSISYQGQILSQVISQTFIGNSDQEKKLKSELNAYVFKNCKGKGIQLSLKEHHDIFNIFFDINEKVRKKFFKNKKILFELPSEEIKYSRIIDDPFISTLTNLFTIVKNNTNNSILSDHYAELFRDSALKLENTSPEFALSLMKLASEIRPNGEFIHKKIKEYQEKL